MKKIFCFLLSLSLVLTTHTVHSQLRISFLPEVYARRVEGLGTFEFHNFTNRVVRGGVLIKVKEASRQTTVLTLSTPEAAFNPGITSFPKLVFIKSAFRFASTDLGALVNQTHSFPPGDYSVCFEFNSSDKQSPDVFEDCFDFRIEPLLPIALITPVHQDTICMKRPILSWQPPVPFHSGGKYRLLLTEKTESSPSESLLKNRPLLLLDNISGNTLLYPASHPELKEGKTYCWQVVAIEKGVIISRSEAWEFTVQCKEQSAPVPMDSYRELKLISNANYYLAQSYLRFAFQNNYNVDKLKIEILDIANGSTPVKHVPEPAIQRGLNKIDLDLTELGLAPGKYYVLKVYPFNEMPIEIRFLYKE